MKHELDGPNDGHVLSTFLASVWWVIELANLVSHSFWYLSIPDEAGAGS